MSSRKRKAADRAALDAVTSSTPSAEPTHLLPAYMERRRRQDAHDAQQRQLRAARKAAGPSATERALMTATADTLPGTRYDWHLDFTRLHSARRVDLRGTPEMDPRLLNRLSAAERMQARERHSLALAALETHAPAQARAYRIAFEEIAVMEDRSWLPPGPAAWADFVEQATAAALDVTPTVGKHRLWAAVRAVLAACDGIVPEVVADYATARQAAIREAARKERVKHERALAAGTVDAAHVRRWRDA